MDTTTFMIIALVSIFVPILLSRFMMESALKQLDTDTKVKLLDAFSAQRKFSLLITVIALVVYLLALQLFTEFVWEVILGFGAGYLIYLVVKSTRNYNKIKALGVPDHYLQRYKLSIVLIGGGFLLAGFEACYMYMMVRS